MSTTVKRRLTTILCADVEGYSRLMELDEAGTMSALRRARAAMTPLVERHDGRIVNTWGDAVIAEFTSVVEAVQCAVEIQQELALVNAPVPQSQRLNFRIGINLGDVMVEGADVYGDGVNIAARLQELSDPGGILISGPVYDQVHDKLKIDFNCLGHRQVRNVAKPVLSYRVTLGPDAPRNRARSARAASGPRLVPAPRADRRGSILAGAWEWYRRLPRFAAAALAIAAFLVLVNVFSGLDTIWFHWAVTPLLLIVVLRAVIRRNPP